MKTLLLLIATTTLFAAQLLAQNIKPGVRTTFHAVDETGKPINEEIITVKITFAKTDANGNKVPVYIEQFSEMTTSDGYFQREIGNTFGDLPDVLYGKYTDVDFTDPKLCVRVDFRRQGFGQQFILGKYMMLNPVPVAAQVLNANDEDDDLDPTNELQILHFNPATDKLSLSDGNTVDLSDLNPFLVEPDGYFTSRVIEAGGFRTNNGLTEVESGKISIRYESGQDGIEMGVDEQWCAPFMTFIDCEGTTLGSIRMGPDGFKFYPGN